jgi:hypothetical protein
MTAAPDTLPLTPDDFEAQDVELDAMREHDEDMPEWEFCEGFLAALVCSRRVIPAEEYWPVLLGDGFRPVEHMEFVWRWRRRWLEVAAALDAPVENLGDERAYRPEVLDTRGAMLSLAEDERGDVDLAALPAYGQIWALGFLFAVETWAEDWEPPRDRQTREMLESALGTIVALTLDDRAPPSFQWSRKTARQASATTGSMRSTTRSGPCTTCACSGRASARASKPCARSRSPDATTRAPAAAARNTRSATGRRDARARPAAQCVTVPRQAPVSTPRCSISSLKRCRLPLVVSFTPPIASPIFSPTVSGS